ncbi:MAG: hypothetical protein ACYC9L_02845 [Sulfuricaulis sp.]
MPTSDERETQALSLRAQAQGLLEMAHAIDGRLPYLAIHEHAYGVSGYVLWHTRPPTQKQASAMLDAQFEPERGENLTIDASLTLVEVTGCGASHVIGARHTNPAKPANNGP